MLSKDIISNIVFIHKLYCCIRRVSTRVVLYRVFELYSIVIIIGSAAFGVKIRRILNRIDLLRFFDGIIVKNQIFFTTFKLRSFIIESNCTMRLNENFLLIH